jgi:hypothetical protein
MLAPCAGCAQALLVGGQRVDDGQEPLDTLLVLDFGTKQWQPCPTRLPHRIRDCAVVVHEGLLHVFGGAEGADGQVRPHHLVGKPLAFRSVDSSEDRDASELLRCTLQKRGPGEFALRVLPQQSGFSYVTVTVNGVPVVDPLLVEAAHDEKSEIGPEPAGLLAGADAGASDAALTLLGTPELPSTAVAEEKVERSAAQFGAPADALHRSSTRRSLSLRRSLWSRLQFPLQRRSLPPRRPSPLRSAGRRRSRRPSPRPRRRRPHPSCIQLRRQ